MIYKHYQSFNTILKRDLGAQVIKEYKFVRAIIIYWLACAVKHLYEAKMGEKDHFHTNRITKPTTKSNTSTRLPHQIPSVCLVHTFPIMTVQNLLKESIKWSK